MKAERERERDRERILACGMRESKKRKKKKKKKKELFLLGEDKLLTLYTAADVVVEEVTIESSLNEAKGPDEPLRVTRLGEITVDPVENVETTVETQTEDVEAGQVLDFARLLKKIDLRDDSN